MFRVRCRKCRQLYLWIDKKEDIKDCIHCHSKMIDIGETVQVSIDDNLEEEEKV